MRHCVTNVTDPHTGLLMAATPNSRHLISTTPRRARCTRCRRTVLDGIDTGVPYRVDAIPLNLHGELAALITGRTSYRVSGQHLTWRDPNNIAADTHRGRPPVCATHSCDPVDPTHLDPTHIHRFTELATETPPTTPPKDREQHALFVLTGAFAGARVIAVPADDQPPF